MEKIKVSLRKDIHSVVTDIKQNLQQIGVSISGGIPTEIFHDDTLKGKGNRNEPLGISDSVLDEIKRGGDTFVFEMGSAQTQWIIEHNLNKRPSVTVVDSADNVVTPAVQYLDDNHIKLEFNAAFKGTAYLN